MFGIGFLRRRLGVVFMAVLAAGALASVAVHASASGAKTAKLPARGGRALRLPGLAKVRSLKNTPEVSPSVTAGATSRAAALTPNGVTTVSCGETLFTSVTLSTNLSCEGQNGLTLAASGITLNLDGHYIYGSTGAEVHTQGVRALSAKDTVEDGYIVGFERGASAEGATDTVTGLQADHASFLGIFLEGADDKATNDTVVGSQTYGMFVEGSNDTAQSDHLLNNGDGLFVQSQDGKVLDNIADGNKNDGMVVEATPAATVTGNVADFNGEYGILAESPEIDGGSNKGSGNGTAEQCFGVVCS